MKRILIFCFVALALTACDKDKVETTPHLKFKSFNSDVLPFSGTLRATLEFTDQEGDLDSIFITRQRTNLRGPSYLDFPYDGIPEFNKQNRGELLVTMNVSDKLMFNLNALRIPGTSPQQFEPDTLLLRFYIKDKEGNVSDTTSPQQLIVIR